VEKEVERLRAALKPFAEVSLPGNWPPGCVLTWNQDDVTPHRALPSYLSIDAQGGPTIGDYRRARKAMGGGE
jgi:hypothetical protein